ncbi:MAG TPA: dioxygenase [Acidimicrobiia bacterium]|nr:dioxygenase [Acidimicrobiia bacterium]
MDEARTGLIVKDILEGLREVIRRHGVTYPEYRRAVEFVVGAARNGEIPLLCDVLLESVVDANRAAVPGTTDSNVAGPFFVAGAPDLGTRGDDGAPVRLPMRPDEPGTRLVFTGTVRSTGGEGLPGAVLDVWQADATGLYSAFAPGLPEWNLRGRVIADDDGSFAIETVVPDAYDIPGEPHTARVLGLLGLEPHRPAHIHVRLEADGHAPLTTQVYFAGDQWLKHDVVGAARPSLVTRLDPADGPDGQGLACRFDFTLAPAG